MGTIDERIVKLSFDNKGFESGIQKTLHSLDNLNKSLKKTEGGQFAGLGTKLSSMFKGSNNGANALARGVETVTARFSHLQVIAVTALSNITNRMVNASIAMAKSLTIDPIKSGLNEYELKMNSIQTILTNTSHNGTTLDQVNKALSELNMYADKTIYNFGQMTDNIGKFTAAGVDLDTSVASIKGIANLAAASGSSSAQASTAMYQLSQALAAGKVSLMDWNSVVNAGMGGKLFQDALIRTSEHMGTGAEAMIKKFGSFRESLTQGEWLTTDVLTETLKQISGAYTEAELKAQGYTDAQAKAIVQLADNATKAATEVKTVTQLFDTMKESVQSGWAQTWEYIIGDKDQATKMLTNVNAAFENMIGPMTEARNKMFKEWNEGGGRDSAIKGFSNIFGSINKVVGSVGESFRDIFPAMTGKRLIELTKGFENFTNKLKVSDETATKIKDTFKGVFSVFDLAKTGVTSIFKAFSGGVDLLAGVGNVLLTITSSIGKFFSAINEGVKSSGIFDKISSSISNGLKGIGEFMGNIFKSMGKINFKPLMDFVGQLGNGFGKGIGNFFSGIGEAVKNIDVNKVLGFVTAISGLKLFDKISKPFDGLTKSFKSFSDIGEAIGDTLSSITAPLKAMSLDINANALLKIAGAIGILALALAGLSSINPEDMANAIMGVTAIMGVLVGAMAMLTKIGSGGSKGGFIGNIIGSLFGGGGTTGAASGLILLSSALLILSGAVKILSSMEPEELITGLAGVAGSMLVLVGTAKLLNGVKGPLIKAGASMILVAAALNVMANAVKKFAEINPNNMLVGLMGIATTLAELAAFMKLANFGGLNVSSAVGLLGVAAALLILQNAVSKFGNMDLKSVGQGLLGVAGALGIIAGFSRLAGSSAIMLVMAAALVVMGGALHVLSSAVRSMSEMDWMDIARGLAVMAGSLAILAGAVALMSGVGLLAVGAGLAVASAGLLLLSTAMKSLAELSWDEMARGLVAMAGGLLVLGVATAAMSGMVVGAGVLLVLAGAMAVLTPQLIAMSNLSWSQVAVGLAMLAGSMVILGVAGVAATAIAPGLAILAGSVTLLGVGCLAAGAGVALFATGLAALAAVGAGGMSAIIVVISNLMNLLPQLGTKMGEFISNMATAIAQGIPQIASAIGQAMVGLLDAIKTYGPQIITVAAELITLLCDALIAAIPKLASTATTLILTLINSLASAGAQIASAGADLIISLLDGLSSRAGDLIQSGIDLAISLLEGLGEGITNNADRISSALETAIEAALGLVGLVIGTGFKVLGKKAVDGFSDGVSDGSKGVGKSIEKPINEAKKTAKTAKSEFKSAGEDMVKGLADGIKSSSAAKEGITKLVDDAVNKAKDASSKFTSAGEEWASKLASGIKSRSSTVNSAVASVINSAVSKAKSGNGQMRSAGAYMMDGFAAGIRSRAASAAAAAASAVAQAITAAKSKLQIHSPSRVFMQIGKWTVMGMEKGLDNNAYRVSRSATNMADSAITAMQSSISMIANAVNDNMDAQPTIRPVLDLSNVEAGARSLNGMLDNSQLSASLSGDISRSIGTIQNGQNEREVLSALKDLKNGLNNQSGNTYNINGVTYDDGSNIHSAVETLIRATKIERRM